MLNNLAILTICTLILAGICVGLAIFLFFKYQIILIFKYLGYSRKFQQTIEWFQRCLHSVKIVFRNKSELFLTPPCQLEYFKPSNDFPDASKSDLFDKKVTDKPDLASELFNPDNRSTNQTTQLRKDYFIITKEVIFLASKEKLEIKNN